MTPPAGSGQRNILKAHYERVGAGPVAYIDETYHVEPDGRRRFYVMAAVVVLEPDEMAACMPWLQRQIVGLEKPIVRVATLATTANPRAIKKQLVALVGGHVYAHCDRAIKHKAPPVSHNRRQRDGRESR